MALLAGCVKGAKLNSAESDIDIKELVNYYSTENTNNESAWITSEKLHVDTGGNELVYYLPKGEFFVSIAPFIDITHT